MTIENVFDTRLEEFIRGDKGAFATVAAFGGLTILQPITVVVFSGIKPEDSSARIGMSCKEARAWAAHLLAAADAVDHYDSTTPCQTCGVRCVTTDTVCELDAANNECATCAQDRIESEIDRIEALREDAYDLRRELNAEDERRDHAVRMADFKAEFKR